MNSQNNFSQKNIDHYFCINLDARKDKWVLVNQQLGKLGLNIERIPGIIKNKNGHWGCMLSHKKIIEESILKKYQRVLVFEDDICIKNPEKIKEQISELSKMTFSIGYLGCTFVHPRAKIREYKDEYFRAKENIYSCYAIIYDNSIFRYLVDEMNLYEEKIRYAGKTFDDIIAKKIQKKYVCILPKKIYIEQSINFSDTEKHIKGWNYWVMNRIGFWTCRYPRIRWLHMFIFFFWSKSVLFFRKKNVGI